MRLHANDRVLLRAELRPAVVDLDADQILVQFVATAQEGLFADELEKPSPFGRSGKLLPASCPRF